MKKLSMVILSLAIMIGSALSHNLYAAEPSQVAADHLSMAKNYEGKVFFSFVGAVGTDDAIIAA